MVYQCNRCGRSFDCDETISFCPFCGTAYATQNTPVQSAARIVIGSDSERTVQEKYWRKTRETIYWLFVSLMDKIPDEDDYEDRELDLNEWMERQRKCRSVSQFKQYCDAFLRKITSALYNESAKDEEQQPIDVDGIGSNISKTGTSLAEALGIAYLPGELPELTYEPAPVQEKSADMPCISDAYRQLMQAVEEVKPVLYSILDENGVFVALSVLGNLSTEEAAKHKPMDLCAQLRELSKKDYDPLFGEEYDDFVQVFWESVLMLADVVNNALALPELDENELAKIQALQTYMLEWREVLNVMLDQVYQSQQEDMIGVYQKIEQFSILMKKGYEE